MIKAPEGSLGSAARVLASSALRGATGAGLAAGRADSLPPGDSGADFGSVVSFFTGSGVGGTTGGGFGGAAEGGFGGASGTGSRGNAGGTAAICHGTNSAPPGTRALATSHIAHATPAKPIPNAIALRNGFEFMAVPIAILRPSDDFPAQSSVFLMVLITRMGIRTYGLCLVAFDLQIGIHLHLNAKNGKPRALKLRSKVSRR